MWKINPTYRDIPEDKENIYPIQNENSAKDFAFQKVVSLEAGYVLLQKMENVFEDKVNHSAKQKEVREIFKTTRESFQKLLKAQEKEFNTSSENNLSTVDFYKKWSQKKAFDKKIHKEVTQTYSKALKRIYALDPEAATQIKKEISISPSLQESVKLHLLALRAVANSDLNRSNKIFQGKLEVAFKNPDGTKTTEVFHDEIKRIDTADFLLQQTHLQVLELQKALLSDPKNPEILAKIAQVNQKIVHYQKMKDESVWRSSMEANAGIREKFEMTTNAWIEKLYPKARPEDPTSFQVARSGAFSHTSNSATNIQTLIEDRAANQFLDLDDEINNREAIIYSQFGAAFMAQIQPLAEGIQTAIDQGEPNYFYDTKTLPYSQISLLHFSGAEKNMLMDMEWLFTRLDGKSVIFDGNAGFDKEGHFHIPQTLVDPKTNQPLELKTSLSLHNFNVQGDLRNRKNIGYQKKVNLAGWKKTRVHFDTYSNWLKTRYPHSKVSGAKLSQMDALKKKIESKFSKEDSDYEIAADIAELERLMETPIGFNCKSGKDRTSYLINLLMDRHLAKYVDDHFYGDPQSINQTKKDLHSQVLKRGGGLYITGLNTGFKAYKITKFFVQGLRIDERLKLYLLALKLR
ncbi:MAG: hypothetical protein CK425_04740 [Parachlamydia sp.]|nr:MAG: hypothetical protein CK425_04740 [Parachlamydia sp.]